MYRASAIVIGLCTFATSVIGEEPDVDTGKELSFMCVTQLEVGDNVPFGSIKEMALSHCGRTLAYRGDDLSLTPELDCFEADLSTGKQSRFFRLRGCTKAIFPVRSTEFCFGFIQSVAGYRDKSAGVGVFLNRADGGARLCMYDNSLTLSANYVPEMNAVCCLRRLPDSDLREVVILNCEDPPSERQVISQIAAEGVWMSPSGSHVLIARDEPASLSIHDLVTKREIVTLEEPPDRIHQAFWCGQDSVLAYCRTTHRLKKWSTKSGKTVWDRALGSDATKFEIEILTSRDLLFSSANSAHRVPGPYTAELISATTGKTLAEISCFAPRAAALSGDGSTIAIAEVVLGIEDADVHNPRLVADVERAQRVRTRPVITIWRSKSAPALNDTVVPHHRVSVH